MFSSVWAAVSQHSLEWPDKPAVIDQEGVCSYGQLYQRTREAAWNLADLGVKKGDYVIIECSQDARFLILDLACELYGAVFVPVERKAVVSRVQEIWKETGAACIIGQTDYSSVGRWYPPERLFVENGMLKESFPDSHAVAEILYSTGTTGKPKGIVLSHRANVAVAENIRYGTGMDENTVEIIPLPLSHSHGIRTCYANLVNGSCVAIMNGVMNIAGFFQMIDTYDVNALDISPTLAKILIKTARKGLEKYRNQIVYIELGTAVLDDEVKEELKKIFPKSRLYNFYGSTEAGRSCVYDFNQEDYSKCIGYPSRHARFFITDEDKNIITATKEKPGLIAVQGEMMMEGYFQAPELTAQTLIGGTIYTSDLGYIDEQGRVYVFGRADDVINYKGIKISPEEIETVAAAYEAVADCACVPVADKLCGQAPKLFVEVNTSEFDKRAYLKYLKENLESSRVPVCIEIIDKIPRTSNGKLLRKQLREQ